MIFDPELSIFWVNIDQHSGGRDTPSIVFLVICHLETVRKELWEIVIPICDWFTLIWSLGLVPRTVHTKRFEEQVAGTCPKNSNQFEFVVTGTSPLVCADL